MLSDVYENISRTFVIEQQSLKRINNPRKALLPFFLKSTIQTHHHLIPPRKKNSKSEIFQFQPAQTNKTKPCGVSLIFPSRSGHSERSTRLTSSQKCHPAHIRWSQATVWPYMFAPLLENTEASSPKQLGGGALGQGFRAAPRPPSINGSETFWWAEFINNLKRD